MRQPLPGDVIVVRTPDHSLVNWAASALIRLGGWLSGEDPHVNHVAVVHHTDAAGTLWAIEARPGGVGWVDAATYANRWMVTNTGQPKTDTQRAAICQAAEGLLGVDYDWAAIGMDAADVLDLDEEWRAPAADRPAHLVCSALASWVYRHVGLPAPPQPWRTTTPGDWAAFIGRHGWA